ncbi:MAG: amidohydrolase family protein [Gemmatimonadetes bacterium]|nr:amidohydrolase family protein [Gemmatimonadota bacterium]
MSLSLCSALAACLPGARGSTTADPVNTADLTITHVAVIDIERGRVVPNQDVLVRGGRIVAVVAANGRRRPGNPRLLDGTGKYVMPGLWDMHVHLNIDATRTPPELPLFVAFGVTGVRIMAADRPSAVPDVTKGLALHRQLQAQIETGTVTGPRLLSLASWPVNGDAGISGSMPPFYRARTRDEGRQLARYFAERDFDFIKIYNDISRDGYLGLAEEARRLEMPFAGHEPAALSAVEMSDAGQKSIEHSRIFLLNCFGGADSLRRGLLRNLSATERRRRMIDEYDPRICANVFRTFARNGTYITPTHVTRRMDAFADDSAYRHDPRLKYIPMRQQIAWAADANGMVASDPSPAGRKSFMDFYRKGLALTNDAYRAGVPVMLGTDANDTFVFPGASVHDELGELVKAGLSPAEALRAATLSGATYLGRTADFGTVQAGRYADLLLLDANPLVNIANSQRIHAVVLGGRVFDRSALDSLLSAVDGDSRAKRVLAVPR